MTIKILELYSGIGGMHYASKESGLDVEIVAAADVNTIANAVYKHNFPDVRLLTRNIQSFTSKEIIKMGPDMILMSPPCQPFTRVGLKKDVTDERTCSLLHIINLLPDIACTVQYILLENVKGFEESEARNRLIQVLHDIGFSYQEFLLSPMQFGIPNSRLRYYLLAKRSPKSFCFKPTCLMKEFPTSLDGGKTTDEILQRINLQHRSMSTEDKAIKDEERHCSDGGFVYPDCYTISRIIETSDHQDEKVQDYLLPEKVLGKCSVVLDVVAPHSKRSCCFTKAYGHYADGTGSVFTNRDMKEVHILRTHNRDLELGSEEQVRQMKSLNLRYFTPREIARLMCFPEEKFFSFPEAVTRKQRYRLLGNSVNVHVIALLISLMIAGD